MPIDKQLHAMGGALIFLVLLVATGLPLLGLAAAIVAAVGKELYDLAHREHHTPDLMDALATAAPAVLGYLILVRWPPPYVPLT